MDYREATKPTATRPCHECQAQVCTAASIAPIEIEAVEELAAMSKDERFKAAHSKINEVVNQVRPYMVAAGEIVAPDKKALIARVSKEPEIWANVMVQMGRLNDTLKAVQNSVDAAEMRLMNRLRQCRISGRLTSSPRRGVGSRLSRPATC
jgi:hypothetical protein